MVAGHTAPCPAQAGAAGDPQVALWLKHTWVATAGPGSPPGCPRAGGQHSCAGRSLLRKCSREEFRVPVRGTSSALAAGRSRFRILCCLGHRGGARSSVTLPSPRTWQGSERALPCPRRTSSAALALLPSGHRCIGCCLRQRSGIEKLLLGSFSVL